MYNETKFTLLVLFLFRSSMCLCQIAWGSYDNRDEFKLVLIERINKSIGLTEGSLPAGDDRSSLANFHVYDITDDGLLDIIYSGPYSEGSAVVLFENKNDSFVKSDFIPGELMGLNRLPLSRTIEIKTHSFPCCAGIVHEITSVIIHSKNEKLEVTEISKDAYLEGTEIYGEEMKPVVFETINSEYKLRSTPEIVTEYDGWYETIDGGNTVAVYPKGSRGKAVGKSTDDTGRVWWLVEMQNNLKPLNSLLYYQNEPDGSRTIGWMSSRYVKVIN